MVDLKVSEMCLWLNCCDDTLVVVWSFSAVRYLQQGYVMKLDSMKAPPLNVSIGYCTAQSKLKKRKHTVCARCGPHYFLVLSFMSIEIWPMECIICLD